MRPSRQGAGVPFVGGSAPASYAIDSFNSATGEYGFAPARVGYASQLQSALTATLVTATLYLRKIGSPAANVRAVLRAETSGAPGTALAVSAWLATSALPASYTGTVFTFPRTLLLGLHPYWLCVELSAIVTDTDNVAVSIAARATYQFLASPPPLPDYDVTVQDPACIRRLVNGTIP